MGNCLRHESTIQWAGDDDCDSSFGEGFFPQETSSEIGYYNTSKDGKRGKGEAIYNEDQDRTKVTTSSEVKIRITKKQLEELIGKVNVKELTVQQVLAYLINHSKEGYEANQRSWRPALQSIPENN